MELVLVTSAFAQHADESDVNVTVPLVRWMQEEWHHWFSTSGHFSYKGLPPASTLNDSAKPAVLNPQASDPAAGLDSSTWVLLGTTAWVRLLRPEELDFRTILKDMSPRLRTVIATALYPMRYIEDYGTALHNELLSRGLIHQDIGNAVENGGIGIIRRPVLDFMDQAVAGGGFKYVHPLGDNAMGFSRFVLAHDDYKIRDLLGDAFYNAQSAASGGLTTLKTGEIAVRGALMLYALSLMSALQAPLMQLIADRSGLKDAHAAYKEMNPEDKDADEQLAAALALIKQAPLAPVTQRLLDTTPSITVELPHNTKAAVGTSASSLRGTLIWRDNGGSLPSNWVETNRSVTPQYTWPLTPVNGATLTLKDLLGLWRAIPEEVKALMPAVATNMGWKPFVEPAAIELNADLMPVIATNGRNFSHDPRLAVWGASYTIWHSHPLEYSMTAFAEVMMGAGDDTPLLSVVPAPALVVRTTAVDRAPPDKVPGTTNSDKAVAGNAPLLPSDFDRGAAVAVSFMPRCMYAGEPDARSLPITALDPQTKVKIEAEDAVRQLRLMADAHPLSRHPVNGSASPITDTDQWRACLRKLHALFTNPNAKGPKDTRLASHLAFEDFEGLKPVTANPNLPNSIAIMSESIATGYGKGGLPVEVMISDKPFARRVTHRVNLPSFHYRSKFGAQGRAIERRYIATSGAPIDIGSWALPEPKPMLDQGRVEAIESRTTPSITLMAILRAAF